MKGITMYGALVSLGVGTAIKAGSDYLKGSISNHFAEKRSRDQAALEYEYAKRYAENSPSWNVSGLRAAGLNPILAASGGFTAPNWKPSSPSAIDTNSGVSINDFNDNVKLDPLSRRQVALLDEQIKGQQIKNKNEEMNRGLTGQYGAYSRLLSEVQNGISTRPSNHDKIMDSISNAINRFGSFIKNSPHPSPVETRTEYQSSLRSASEDSPPSMKEHQKYIDFGDGFNSIDYHRSKSKFDDKYLYRKREPWEKVFRW